MGGGVVTAFLGTAKRLLCPIQVAVGAKGSADKLVFGMRALVKMKAGEQAGLRKPDVCNLVCATPTPSRSLIEATLCA
jgi:hypothetical protein